jgi:dTDP-4-dehydrorhamnose reductase
MDRLKILITGGNGYIAKSIYSYLYSKYDITLLTRQIVDMCDSNKLKEFFI